MPAPESGGTDIDCRSQGAARQEGRLLCRGDREAGPCRDRGDRRDSSEVVRIFRGRNRCAGARLEGARRADLGAALAFHRRRLRAGDEEPDIVPFSVCGLGAGDKTRGHRSSARRRSGALARRLHGEARQGQGGARRRAAEEHYPDRSQATRLAQGLELVEDDGLLNEVSGLVEWPVVPWAGSTPSSCASPRK